MKPLDCITKNTLITLVQLKGKQIMHRIVQIHTETNAITNKKPLCTYCKKKKKKVHIHTEIPNDFFITNAKAFEGIFLSVPNKAAVLL